MTARFIATLPMYDWAEVAADVDREFVGFADQMGMVLGDDITVVRPENSARTDALWRDPHLLLGQTCWGPLNAGLKDHVQVLAQPDYSEFEGGDGPFYRSVLIARTTTQRLDDARYAFNMLGSLSGYLALDADLDRGIEGTFSQVVETGSHRASARAVAQGLADVAAIDCRSWHLARKFEPATKDLHVIGTTKLRLGLPYICSPAIDADLVAKAKAALIRLGGHPPHLD